MVLKTKSRIVSNLKQICKEKNISVYRLTKDIGLSTGALNHVANNNRYPTKEVLAALCDALNVEPGDILKLEAYVEIDKN